MKKFILYLLTGLLFCQVGNAASYPGDKINPKFNRDIQEDLIPIPEVNQENCSNTNLISDTISTIMNHSKNAQSAKVNLDQLYEYEQKCELIKKETREREKALRLEQRAKFLKERDERRKRQAMLQGQDKEKLPKNRNRDLDYR